MEAHRPLRRLARRREELKAPVARPGARLHAERSAPGPRVPAVHSLDREMAAIDGFRCVLTDLAATIDANWQGTIDQTGPEFLHDLRIAVRRTRTVLGAAKRVFPAPLGDDAREGFAWLADLTTTPRDLDVYLLEWSSYTEPFDARVVAQLEPVRDRLERHRGNAHTELQRALDSDRATTLMEAWPALLATRPDNDLPQWALRPLGDVVAKRISRAHHRLLEHGRLIGPETVAERLHDLRKDAKKLRYLLECFDELFPKRALKRCTKRLRALQDNLGEHQDAVVHVQLLRTVARELHAAGASADTMVSIGQLTERLDQQRREARAEFAERFAAFDTPKTQATIDALLTRVTT